MESNLIFNPKKFKHIRSQSDRPVILFYHLTYNRLLSSSISALDQAGKGSSHLTHLFLFIHRLFPLYLEGDSKQTILDELFDKVSLIFALVDTRCGGALLA